MLIGFDLKKDPDKILAAYNDTEGVTRDFNLNLLRRINKELAADFDLNQFIHNPVYDPMTGECRSYVISTEAQTVNVQALGLQFSFSKWEAVFMEVSKKYDLLEIENLASQTGFEVKDHLLDKGDQFADSIWEAI